MVELERRLSLTDETKTDIEMSVDEFLARQQKTTLATTRLTFDAITVLTATEARAQELAEQGPFARLWNNITGKNAKLRARVHQGFVESQYASLKLIQQLAEQNRLTFDVITAVNNKLNSIALDLEQDLATICHVLKRFFVETRAKVVDLAKRMEEAERRLDLFEWSLTIEYITFDGVSYEQLSDDEKLVCVANDFFHYTRGEWTSRDLLVLKSSLARLALRPDSTTSLQSFFRALAASPKLIERLFHDIPLDGLALVHPGEAPVIKGIEHYTKLSGEDRYIVDAVAEQLDAANVAYDRRELQLNIVQQYVLRSALRKSDVEMELFDFVVELLLNLKIAHEASADDAGDDVRDRLPAVADGTDVNGKLIPAHNVSDVGEVIWSLFTREPEGSGDPLVAAAADGMCYIASKGKSRTSIRALSPDGDIRWRKAIAMKVHRLEMDAEGNAYVAELTPGAERIASYSPDGEKRWERMVQMCAVDPNGQLFALSGSGLLVLDGQGERVRELGALDRNQVVGADRGVVSPKGDLVFFNYKENGFAKISGSDGQVAIHPVDGGTRSYPPEISSFYLRDGTGALYVAWHGRRRTRLVPVEDHVAASVGSGDDDITIHGPLTYGSAKAVSASRDDVVALFDRGTVLALRADGGRRMYAPPQGYRFVAPPIIGTDETIYALIEDSAPAYHLACLTWEAEIVWTSLLFDFPAGGECFSRLYLRDDGVLYVIARHPKRKLIAAYAVQTEAVQP